MLQCIFKTCSSFLALTTQLLPAVRAGAVKLEPQPGHTFAVCSVKCEVCSVQYAVCSVQCSVCRVQFALCNSPAADGRPLDKGVLRQVLLRCYLKSRTFHISSYSSFLSSLFFSSSKSSVFCTENKATFCGLLRPASVPLQEASFTAYTFC